MNEKVVVTTHDAPTPSGPYSQAIIANGFVFVAGQRPQDPVSGELAVGITDQTRRCLKNLKAILEAAGSSLELIVNTHVYLSDIADFGAMNEVYREMIPAPHPTRTTIAAQLRGILVEIEAIAVMPHDGVTSIDAVAR